MAFYLQFNGSSNATAPTLGNILTSTVKFSQQNAVLQTNDTSYWLSQAAGGNRELGIFTLSGNVSLFAGGAQTSAIISGNEVIAEFGSSLIVSDLFEFEINMNTGEYAFYNNSATPFKTGTAAVGTNRIDGCLFRIGGRGGNNTPGSTASSFVPRSQWQAGNTYVTVDGILERSFESTGVDSNWDDITNNQDATVQGATLPADWVFYDAGGATYTLTFDPATFLLTGSDLNLAANRNVSLDVGSYSYTGNDINLAANRNIIFDADSYSYIGNDIDLAVSRNLLFDSGSYSYTGNDTNIRASRKVTLETGTYALTGNDLTLTYNQAGGSTYTISLNAGSYLISGGDIQLSANRALLLDAGDYAYTGEPVILAANRVMSLEGGAYNINGNDLNLIANRSITFNTGEYDVVGNPMTLTYSGQIISLMDTYSVNYTNEFVTASYSNNYITAEFK